MSAPRRWLESEEASSEALELLRAGRPPRSMDEAVRRRSRRRVAGLATLPAAAGALAAWPQLALGALVGVTGTVAVMTALSVGGTPAETNTSTAPPAVVRAAPAPTPVPTPVSSASPTDDDAAPRLAAPAGTRRVTSGPQATMSEAPRPVAVAEGLQQEIQLLEEARSKLAADPASAERALLEHERRFPAGQLRVEREFLMIDSLVRLGRRGQAEQRARALQGQAPKSLYGERLEQILGHSATGK
jgi:hypothetical protein